MCLVKVLLQSNGLAQNSAHDKVTFHFLTAVKFQLETHAQLVSWKQNNQKNENEQGVVVSLSVRRPRAEEVKGQNWMVTVALMSHSSF